VKLTTKGRYAVTAMLDLALHKNKGPIALVDIAARQGISLSYLEQLFSRLRRNGLVASVRGPGGGYHLASEAKEINIAAVITAVDEKVDATRCEGKHDCQGNERCLTHDLWHDLSEQIYSYLSGISLQDIVEQNAVKKVAKRQDKESNIDNVLDLNIASAAN